MHGRKNRLFLVPSIVSIVVASAGAARAEDAITLRRPVTVDPLATVADWIAESDQATAQYGVSVASAGDVDNDGYDDVIVGAWRYANDHGLEGRAYVYHGSATGLAAVEAWTAESDQHLSAYGLSVSTAGDVNGDGYDDVIVGAYRYENGDTLEGRAYVYHGSAAGLGAVPAWTAEGDHDLATFGESVAAAGDVNGDGYDDVVIGAYSYSNDQTDEGRAYVFLGSAAGLSATPSWTGEGDQAFAYFGASVGTAGDVNGDGYDDVIVGADGYHNGEASEGRAYVFLGSETGLGAVESWSAEGDQAEAFFGWSVGTAGDVNGDGYDDVIVGAYGYDNDQVDEGRVFVYLGSETGLGDVEAWTAESDQASSRFGISVATAGDVDGSGRADVIVGAETYDNGQTDEGRAYVYAGSDSGLSIVEIWTAEGDQAVASFGRSAATAGDVNGDGISDVIVGAHYATNGEIDEGRAFVYHGGGAEAPSGSIPDETPLLVTKSVFGALRLTWGGSCLAGDVDFGVYEGLLGDFTTHEPRTCTTEGATELTLLPASGDRYFLVVPANPSREGSHGRSSDGLERQRGGVVCLPQAVGPCG